MISSFPSFFLLLIVSYLIISILNIISFMRKCQGRRLGDLNNLRSRSARGKRQIIGMGFLWEMVGRIY